MPKRGQTCHLRARQQEVKCALSTPGRGLSPPQTHGVSRQWPRPVPAHTHLDTPRGHGETVYKGRVTFRVTTGTTSGPLGQEQKEATGP